MNRRRGKHLCRIREQNQLRHSVVAVPDSGILGLQAEEDVKHNDWEKVKKQPWTEKPRAGHGAL